MALITDDMYEVLMYFRSKIPEPVQRAQFYADYQGNDDAVWAELMIHDYIYLTDDGRGYYLTKKADVAIRNKEEGVEF